MSSSERASEARPTSSEDIGRVVAFTDGVIAIAITLLVLDIAVPEIPDALVDKELGDALWELRPQVFGFVLSFALIAYYWLSHRLLFSHLRTIDLPLVIINLLFLLVIAFIPFAAGLLSEYIPDGLAVACYSGVIAIAGFTLLVMVIYPKDKGHFHPTVSLSHVSLITKELAVAPLVYLVAAPTAFLNGWVALSLFVLVPAGRYVIRRRWSDH